MKRMLVSACLILALLGTRRASADDEAKEPIPFGRYLAGGIVGTAVGFGIGHGIAGEYGSTGWIFTVTESVGMGMYAVGFAQQLSSIEGSSDQSSTGDTDGFKLMLAGIGVWLGFHIWETVDVWTRPRHLDPGERRASQGPRLALFPAVIGTSKGLGLALAY